jgi:AcrR family transcriptional regulator
MFIKNKRFAGTRKRGRPVGPTPQAAETRSELYRIAIGLFAEQGYAETTLRQIAKRARVSPALLYRYFPSKRAVVLALYDELSLPFEERARGVPAGNWRERFAFTLRTSLAVLAPHRTTLVALVPLLVGGADNLFAPATAFSRERVQRAFVLAVTEATDAPRGALAPALGRLFYLAHLGLILWWLLDRTPGQRATNAVLALTERALTPVRLALALPGVRGLVTELDRCAQEALFGVNEA